MRILLALIFLLLATTTHGQKKEFGWLIGEWKLKGKEVYEVWQLDTDNKTLKGVSYEVKNGKREIADEIKIVHNGKSFAYVPDIAGDQGAVEFAITKFDKTSFTSENPKHDFPKVIRYRLVKIDGKDCIEAAIEGDGKVIPYNFERVK